MLKPSSGFEARPSAIFFSAEAPYPPVGGGALRSASVLEYLAGRYAVDVIVFRQPGAPDPRDSFPAGRARRVHVIDLPYHSRSAPAKIVRAVSRVLRRRPPLIDRFSGFGPAVEQCLERQSYDIAIIEHLWCAEYVTQVRKHARRVLLDIHNIESVWHDRLAQSAAPIEALALKIFASASGKFEERWLKEFDALLVTSDEDSRRLNGCRKIVYPNALPLVDRPVRQQDEAIVFTGNLEYQPNISAVRFFRQKIWPLLRHRAPNLVWRIAGKNSKAVSALVNGDPRVHLIDSINNAVEAIASAKVAVVPLLAGSGTRFKILEAWAAGTPVVSTSVGAEGLHYNRGEHLLIADDPAEFAEAVVFLLDAPEARAQLAAAGRRLYETRYTWNVAWDVLNRELRPLFNTE